MARRGTELSEHILRAAKDVFLEVGFERATMDMIAARAQTSKRTLYAHFENKEKLYLAVIKLVRGLFLGRIKMPTDYKGTPEEVLVQYCGRFLEVLLYNPVIQMCRASIAEAERFPDGSAQYFDVVFTEVQERLAGYMEAQFGMPTPDAVELAAELLGRILFPRFPRALFGLEKLADRLEDEMSADFDLEAVRVAVRRVLRG
ncbi:TetR/AcrR family transcriptional regulator [bacterium]|nr:MAG: TetR/AcrR family transcriptional regulator [bacterium]